jgi:hypothetical protein
MRLPFLSAVAIVAIAGCSRLPKPSIRFLLMKAFGLACHH